MQLFEKFVNFYKSFSPESLGDMNDIYDKNVIFEDPITRLEGIDAVKTHFAWTMKGVDQCEFEIIRAHSGDSLGYLEWNMHYSHHRLSGGKPLTLNGVSVLQLGEKVVSHKDYYDMGQMVYEHLPILRKIIGVVKGSLKPREKAS